MQLDDRSHALLSEIVLRPSIRTPQLGQKFALSRRQVDYSIGKINDWLRTQQLPTIRKGSKGSLLVDPLIFERLSELLPNQNEYHYILSETERAQVILLQLLAARQELSLRDFMESLYVSKNTVLNDLKLCQEYAERFRLTVTYSRKKGYMIHGSELDSRRVLVDVVQKLLSLPSGENLLTDVTKIDTHELRRMENRLGLFEKELNVRFTDDKLRELPFVLVIVLRRIRQGYQLDDSEIEFQHFVNSREYGIVDKLLSGTAHMTNAEKLFVTVLLMSTNVTSAGPLTSDHPELLAALRQTVDRFEKLALVQFDDKEALVSKLYLHFKPAYYRIRYGFLVENPLLDEVTRSYKELHCIVKQSIEPLNMMFDFGIPDSELVYLTILIGGWIRQSGALMPARIKAIVVCPSGVSVSRLLFDQLKVLFPEFLFLESLSVREFNEYPVDYDVVFSTGFLSTKKKLFVVKAIMSDAEASELYFRVMNAMLRIVTRKYDVHSLLHVIKEHAEVRDEDEMRRALSNYLEHESSYSNSGTIQHSGSVSLTDLITEETISLYTAVDSWQDAIRVASRPLISNGSIEPRYVDAMLKLHNPSDPYMVIGPRVAIPHASPDWGVNRLSISMLRLRDGVEFSKGVPVNIVVVIAAVDKNSHIKALHQLTGILTCKEAVHALVSSESTKDMLSLIHHFIDVQGN